ncbi:MAG TPA: error-prone DNA polymerase, partial [Planctomycetaceae bacterium]|nr:error-prone DNA polymerase [Planctomycetaceae bacterium]
WDKDDLDMLGILKVDCLALGMLTAIRKAFELVRRHTGRKLTLANVPAEDPRVYEMISRADTRGVFQIESRAQMSMLPRLRPRCFYDLVIEVALVRPGPIQGDMVHPYLRRRAGQEQVEYPDDRIRAVLEKTLGVPIFQEQAMRLAVVAAGFTPGEADQLRRAMGAWRRPGLIDQFRQKLIQGMVAQGYSQKFAEQVFRQIRGFGDYGFPESHAASFALLVYVSAWLKRYYPAAFTAALLNSQPMGFYAPAQLVADTQKHGVDVRPVDVNFSHWDCTLEPAAAPLPVPPTKRPKNALPESGPGLAKDPWALRLGFRMVKGLSEKHAERIVRQRTESPYRSVDDFVRRTGLAGGPLRQLALADAFASLGLNRRQAFWKALPRQPLAPLLRTDEEPPAALPPLSIQAEVAADYQTFGLSLRRHPMSFLRGRLEMWQVVPAERLDQLPPGTPLKVAGVVLLRQRPSTASGITFVTLEDETGLVNLIVRPDVWQRYRRAAHTATALLAWGRLQRESD